MLTHSLKTFCKDSAQMSELVLSCFGGILPKVVALFEFKFFISVSILEIVTCSKEKPATTGKRVRTAFILDGLHTFQLLYPLDR